MSSARSTASSGSVRCRSTTLRARVPLEGVFGTSPDVSPYHALTPSVSLDEKNAAKGKAAELSSAVDFDHVDNVDDALFKTGSWWEWRAPRKPAIPTH